MGERYRERGEKVVTPSGKVATVVKSYPGIGIITARTGPLSLVKEYGYADLTSFTGSHANLGR